MIRGISGAYFINSRQRRKSFPQELKPEYLLTPHGTAEAVPLQNVICETCSSLLYYPSHFCNRPKPHWSTQELMDSSCSADSLD